MDILTALNPETEYSTNQLQVILGAWVLSTAFERRKKIQTNNGTVSEDDYTKQSVYSLLYSLYRQVGAVKDEHGTPYEFTFNTWGYAWPSDLGKSPVAEDGTFAIDGIPAHTSIQVRWISPRTHGERSPRRLRRRGRTSMDRGGRSCRGSSSSCR